MLEVVPLRTDADGVVRVGGTRVTLDTVVEAFQDGATAEEIVQQYPSLVLADAYQIFGYYLKHADELGTYFAKRAVNSEAARRDSKLRCDPRGVRERLLGMRRSAGSPGAAET